MGFAELRYLFDWSLPLHCPELAKQLTIPRYFARDFLQRTPPGSLYRDSWPSLFLSPAGITSELHVDAFGSNFWMALFQGRKRSAPYIARETNGDMFLGLTLTIDPVNFCITDATSPCL